jgi:hypothetical protein
VGCLKQVGRLGGGKLGRWAAEQWEMGLHGHPRLGLLEWLLPPRCETQGVDHPMWVSVQVGCLSHVGRWAGGLLSKYGQVGRWDVFDIWVGGLLGCWAIFKRWAGGQVGRWAVFKKSTVNGQRSTDGQWSTVNGWSMGRIHESEYIREALAVAKAMAKSMAAATRC